MAIVKCGECGGELSTKAAACPNCGVKRKQMSGCLKILLLFVLALFLLAVIAGIFGDKNTPDENNQSSPTSRDASPRGYALTEIEGAVLEAMLKEEVSVFLNGGDSLIFSDGPLAVSAIEASRKYEANQVAADEEYFKKPLLVSGKISSINSGLGNEPYVVLDGVNLLSSPQVDFKKPDVQRIASLAKGNKVSFVCEGAGAIVGTPMFKNCTFADVYAAERTQTVKADALKFLSGNRVSGDIAPMMTIGAIAAARELPETSACITSSNECIAEIGAALESSDADQRIAAVANELAQLGLRVPDTIGK